MPGKTDAEVKFIKHSTHSIHDTWAIMKAEIGFYKTYLGYPISNVILNCCKNGREHATKRETITRELLFWE